MVSKTQSRRPVALENCATFLSCGGFPFLPGSGVAHGHLGMRSSEDEGGWPVGCSGHCGNTSGPRALQMGYIQAFSGPLP